MARKKGQVTSIFAEINDEEIHTILATTSNLCLESVLKDQRMSLISRQDEYQKERKRKFSALDIEIEIGEERKEEGNVEKRNEEECEDDEEEHSNISYSGLGNKTTIAALGLSQSRAEKKAKEEAERLSAHEKALSKKQHLMTTEYSHTQIKINYLQPFTTKNFFDKSFNSHNIDSGIFRVQRILHNWCV